MTEKKIPREGGVEMLHKEGMLLAQIILRNQAIKKPFKIN
jgi:hypothetical protein